LLSGSATHGLIAFSWLLCWGVSRLLRSSSSLAVLSPVKISRFSLVLLPDLLSAPPVDKKVFAATHSCQVPPVYLAASATTRTFSTCNTWPAVHGQASSLLLGLECLF
jgi:hypothetical protein